MNHPSESILASTKTWSPWTRWTAEY